MCSFIKKIWDNLRKIVSLNYNEAKISKVPPIVLYLHATTLPTLLI